MNGALCIRRPWPGMARTLYGNHSRFLDTYFKPYPGELSIVTSPHNSTRFFLYHTNHDHFQNSSLLGYYFSGDGAFRDKDGYYQMTGRMDDVINISGHRMGTAEIEDVLVSLNGLCHHQSFKER